MDNDKHASDKICNLTTLKKNYQFDVVPNDFPLIEDGMLSIPFLAKHQYNVANNAQTLHEVI